jgi:hypothetical protein
MHRAAAALVAALLLASCGSDSAPKPTALSSSQALTTTSTTTSTTTTSTTVATVPLSPAPSASDAATTFVNAWRQGNQLLAGTIALPAAVDAVFSAGEPGSVQNRGCNEPPQPPVLCVYKTDAGELQLRIRPQDDGWIVDQARLTAA